MNLCFGGKDPEKEKADKEAREKARKNEFPHDVAYLYLRKDLVKTTEIIKSKTDGTPLLWKDKWQMWDEERLRAYFIPISKNTPIDIVLKKRCSAEGPLWELWKNFRDNGKHLTVELAKNYKEQYEEGERLMRDPSKALPPDKLFNSLKIR